MRRLPLLPLLWSVTSFSLLANPTGGVVANGSANIAGQGTASVLINQASDKAIINWQTFSINGGELTKFVQPSSTSATLNRVLGGQTSYINGTLSANGQIFLLNGNGIVVGPGGVISTAGFTGSTRDIADSDFLSGNLHFVGSGDGGVKNLGTISALGGDVVLLGKTVENAGTIKATGTAALVAGDDILLAQKNADGSTVTVSPVSSPTAASQKVGVKNTGLIQASTAELKAANGNIYALAIQNEGMVQATTVTQQGGHIFLTSDEGTIVNSGTLDASATAAGGQGGTVLVKSAGGKVVHSGTILARGGANGAGGQVEISGAQVDFTGLVDTRATGGKTGSLLLDPANLIVNSTGTGSAANTSYVSNGSVDSTLSDTDLTLNADQSIAINAAIEWDSASTLTLSTNTSGSTIQINAPISGTSGSLTIDTASTSDVISTTLAGTVDVENFYLQSGSWFQLINDGSGNGGDLPQTIVNHVAENILPEFDVTGDFEISNGAAFLRADSGNGTTVYYGLEDIYGVQGINGYLNSNFTLNGSDIDATVTQYWNPTGGEGSYNQGFVPIGFYSEGGYEGTLTNGSIDHLTIDRPNDSDIGLSSSLESSGSITNVQLNYATITGGSDVGGFAGENYGRIDSVSFYDGSVTGSSDVGGLVGYQTGGYLDDNDDQTHVNSSSVSNATITGTSSVGGAVGENAGQVDGISVYGPTTVEGNGNVGGVVGYNDASSDYENGLTPTITYATFSGLVTYNDTPGGSYNLGGIAGENDGLIQDSNTFPTYTNSQGNVVSTTVTGDEDVGGIAGYNTGTIEDSFNAANVTGVTNNATDYSNEYIGGIAGENNALESEGNDGGGEEESDTVINQPSFSQYGDVQTSYNSGVISGGTYVGGLVGSNDYSGNVVTTAYNVGAVTGTGYVGGLAGANAGTIEYTYSSGLVTGSNASTTGALVGSNSGYTDYSYWDSSTSIAPQSTLGAIGTNTGTMAEVRTVSTTDGTAYEIDNNDTENGSGYGFFGAASPESNVTDLSNNGVYVIGSAPENESNDFGDAGWIILPGDTRPMLAMEFTGNVNSPHALQLISSDLGGNFYVQQNLDLSVINNAAEVWSSKGFAPIGGDPNSELNDFSGIFYGNGDTISSLYINRPTDSDVGLFGYVGDTLSQGYTLSEVNFQDASITGAGDVGVLAGINTGTISYVTSNNSTVTGNGDVGGLTGENTGKMTQVQNTTSDDDDVTGTFNVGGISGESSGQITYAQNSATIYGNNGVGGIVGAIDGIGVSNLIGESENTGTISGTGNSPTKLGGIAGVSAGTITQSLNLGTVGETGNSETAVGGIVGENVGQVDDSYSETENGAGTISGQDQVGGIAGLNYSVVETSYSTATVDGTGTGVGNLVGFNNGGTVTHSYWDTDTASVANGIGTDEGTSSDVVGYTTAQLTDARNYAQGSGPQLWDFSPLTNGTAGVWGVNVYDYNGAINNGLPVLQWQTPVDVQVAATNGQQYYGYTPGYKVKGDDAGQLSQALPSGVTFTESGGNQAGDTDELTVSGTPSSSASYLTVEYVNGTVDITPAPLYIVANSYTVPLDSTTPNYGATYTGLQNGDTPTSLNGILNYVVAPNATNFAGLYSILVNGQNSSNYAISFIPGTLNVVKAGASTTIQQASTVTAEINTITNFFAMDPTNGIDPIYFMIFPDQFGLDGDLIGAVNNEPDKHDYAYGSSTSNLPALSRLVVPDTGVVEIVNGVVVIGTPGSNGPVYLTNPGSFLPANVVHNLNDVLGQSAYNQLLPLINGAP